MPLIPYPLADPLLLIFDSHRSEAMSLSVLNIAFVDLSLIVPGLSTDPLHLSVLELARVSHVSICKIIDTLSLIHI